MWDDNCEHVYSYGCSCECDHWCWHKYEYECREYDCDCDGNSRQSSQADEKDDSAPFTLKDAAVLAGGAALVFGALKVFGKKPGNAEDDNEAARVVSSELTQSTPVPAAVPAPRSLPPAGWYEDGSTARLRWWDGAQWTEHFYQPVPTAAPPGWYNDGVRGIRWWDGRGWTQHLSQ